MIHLQTLTSSLRTGNRFEIDVRGPSVTIHFVVWYTLCVLLEAKALFRCFVDIIMTLEKKSDVSGRFILSVPELTSNSATCTISSSGSHETMNEPPLVPTRTHLMSINNVDRDRKSSLLTGRKRSQTMRC